jgi:hypothetical protein
MTQEQARAIIEAHDIASFLEDDEEYELLQANNPQLLRAYEALIELAGW